MGSTLSLCEAPACPNFDYSKNKDDKLDKIINLLEKQQLTCSSYKPETDGEKWNRVKNEILEYMRRNQMSDGYILKFESFQEPKEVNIQCNNEIDGYNFSVIYSKLDIAYPYTFNVEPIIPGQRRLYCAIKDNDDPIPIKC